MILLMNIIIALTGVIGIVATMKFSKLGGKMDLKSHFVILGIKLIFMSVIVSLFCLSAEKNVYAILILTGLLNLIVFHFIEGFVIQKIIITNRNLNV